MPYSMSNKPQWLKNKSDAVARRSIAAYNEEFKKTGSEEKARIVALAVMREAEQEFKRRAAGINKSLNTKDIILDIVKSSQLKEIKCQR